MPDWKKDFEKFLSDRAIKTRKSLLGISAIAWFIVLTGSVPTHISWVGITFSEAERDGIWVFLCFTLLYFAVSFYFESSPQRRRWGGKIAQRKLGELKGDELDWVRKQGPKKLRDSRKKLDERFENVYGPTPEGEENTGWDMVLEQMTDEYEQELSKANPSIAEKQEKLRKLKQELSAEVPRWYRRRVWFELKLPIWSTGGVIALLILRRFTLGF